MNKISKTATIAIFAFAIGFLPMAGTSAAAKNQAALEEQAMVIATTITLIPASNPIYKNVPELEGYIYALSKRMDRDLVVVDTKKTILSDTISANVGTTYKDDAKDEVAQTLEDGKMRSYVAMSTDYPKGIEEVVVAFRDGANKIAGALILSSEHISANKKK